MPYSDNLDELPVVIDAVNNPVRSDNDFTDSGVAILRDNSANLGKVLELVSLCDETIAECFRALTAVAGNEGYNVAQIITGGLEAKSVCKP
jgi:hypothetical protein